ncbi:hypothetical protein [Telmatospirillum sp.]|uniref:hypothetical protein n=1 Tax=Telmatospirillum sp. TaxID=2079197 RepID=UPI00283E2E86|nr:hypothetical protein [Telmatospirillum sp.]MDR3440545.1 hypothetical protein [Telmatospirillum sp.]
MAEPAFDTPTTTAGDRSVAVRTLEFLAGNRIEFDHFLSGISQDDLERYPICGRSLATVLDLLILKEATFLGFLRTTGLPPKAAHGSRCADDTPSKRDR